MSDPAPSTDVDKFKKATEDLGKVNQRLAQLVGQREQIQAQLTEILTKYNVATVDELKALHTKASDEAIALYQEISTYLTDTGQHFKALDDVLALS